VAEPMAKPPKFCFFFFFLALGGNRTTHAALGGGSATPKGQTPKILFFFFYYSFWPWGGCTTPKGQTPKILFFFFLNVVATSVLTWTTVSFLTKIWTDVQFSSFSIVQIPAVIKNEAQWAKYKK
jgi:hypothetical protein